MLAIDRLGAGKSDHPNPYTEVQANLQTSIHHEIVQLARSGGIPQSGGVKFEKVRQDDQCAKDLADCF